MQIGTLCRCTVAAVVLLTAALGPSLSLAAPPTQNVNVVNTPSVSGAPTVVVSNTSPRIDNTTTTIDLDVSAYKLLRVVIQGSRPGCTLNGSVSIMDPTAQPFTIDSFIGQSSFTNIYDMPGVQIRLDIVNNDCVLDNLTTVTVYGRSN